jgi:hypothetical protein
MAKQRKRQRKGLHESVGGQAAAEALRDLVRQFANPYAFVRELIQNSLDAGASSIDVDMVYSKGMLEVVVQDDGEGMDQATIEGYLLTLFRSTKEEDLTKIGKFGIGFVSLFAMGPQRVLVDTGRDGIWHRVIFHEDRSYTLMRLDDPLEGTTVTLEMKRKPAEAAKDCRSIHESAQQWCRFADAEIYTSAKGVTGAWRPKTIEVPFTVETPVFVEEEADGFHAIVGPACKPSVGYYNHGLTLWESDDALLPGVTFRVKGRHLEHTLTRDNVRRDRHFDVVMDRVKTLAKGRLGHAIHAALRDAKNLQASEHLFASLAPDVAWAWDHTAPLVPAVGRGFLSINELEALVPSRFSRLLGAEATTLLFGHPDSPLAVAVAKTGRLVIAATSDKAPQLAWAAAWTQGELASVADAFVMPLFASPSASQNDLLMATAHLGQQLGYPLDVRPADLSHTGKELANSLAVATPAGSDVVERPLPAPSTKMTVWVNLRHSLLKDLQGLPADMAAPLLLRGLLVATDMTGPGLAALVEAATEAASQ